MRRSGIEKFFIDEQTKRGTYVFFVPDKRTMRIIHEGGEYSTKSVVWGGGEPIERVILKDPKPRATREAVLRETARDVENFGDELLALYKPMVLARVSERFNTAAEAEEWFHHGHISGYGERTPEQLVREGRASWVIEAIEAAEAGVFG